MRKIRTGVVAVVACAATATTSGCGASSNETEGGPQTSKPTATATATSTPKATASQSASRLGQAVRAVRTAQRRIRRSKAYDIETDRFRGRRVWEVKVARGVTRPYELDVRADGRRVVRQRRKTRIDDDVRKLARATVTLPRALRTAARRARGARFDEAEIDRSRGRLVWDVEFKRSRDREVEVKVDARTGRVLEVDVDD
jgi:uncharacterized membrane protein YkoI